MQNERESLDPLRGNVNAGGPRTERAAGLLAAALAGIGTSDVLLGVARSAVEDVGERFVMLLARDAQSGTLALRATFGLDDVEHRGTVLAFARSLAAWVERTRAPLVVPDPSADARFPDAPLRSPALAFPLQSGGEVVGALVAISSEDATLPREECEASLALLAAVATAALREAAVRESMRDLQKRYVESERRRLQVERQAGGLADAEDLARDMRATLSSLGGLGLKLSQSIDDDDDRGPVVEMMLEEIRRLTRLLQERGALGRGERTLAPDEMNRLVSECVALCAPRFKAKEIAPAVRLGSSMPALLIDPEAMRSVLLRVLERAAEGAPTRGRVRVETKRRGAQVEIIVTSQREGPLVALDELWIPFVVDPGAGGPSLSAVRDLLQDLEASVEAATAPEGVAYRITIPIAGNLERRTPKSRRVGRDRRRA